MEPRICQATAAAPPNHYARAVTYGHVCTIGAGHSILHLCRCGQTWDDAPRWLTREAFVTMSPEDLNAFFEANGIDVRVVT